MNEAIDKYVSYILNGFLSDVEGFNHWWMLFILPAAIYFMFIVLKYLVLTIPIWLPLSLILSSFKRKK